jgi:hypothetical protein
MRPINVTLDSGTWELAKEKSNFSEWVRDQLRSERNKKKELEDKTPWKWCYACDKSQKTHSLVCHNKHCDEYFVAILEDLE